MEILSISESQGSPYIAELRFMLEQEWGVFSAFETVVSGIKAPAPMVAVAHNKVIGGLVYSVWENPEKKQQHVVEGITQPPVVWINGVIVAPTWRKKGVACALIRKAMHQKPLFALTDIPQLYEKVGWRILSESEKGFIVRT